MTPIERAAAWHAEHGGEMSFMELIAAHGRHGYVIATPEVFLLARRARSYWPECLRLDPWHVAADGNCWHVWLAAGEWRAWQPFLPYPLPFVSMHRHGKLRVVALERFRRLKWRGGAPAGETAGNGKQGTETQGSRATATGAENGGCLRGGQRGDV
jgi:hypothetical protein